MKKIGWILFFSLLAVSLFPQSREDTTIFIAPVIASRPDHAAYFHENFTMEVIAANYAIAENSREADYIFNLEVVPNIVHYDDGTSELAPWDEPQWILNLNLVRSEDDVEIVAFGFPFTEVEEMYDFNLFLVYNAMANVPITKLMGGIEDDDRWRNKWLYVRVSFDYPVITTHQLSSEGLYRGAAVWNPDNNQYQVLDHIVRAVPGATLGLELQFLHWMSTEFGFLLRFGDPLGYTFIPGIGVQLKFPLKPSRHFMLEPYGMFNIEMNTAAHYKSYPRFGVGGGFQFGVKGGDSGAFFIDVNFLYSLGNVVTNNPHAADFPVPAEIHYARYTVGIGIGFKLGFFDRPPRPPREN